MFWWLEETAVKLLDWKEKVTIKRVNDCVKQLWEILKIHDFERFMFETHNTEQMAYNSNVHFQWAKNACQCHSH